VWHPSFIDCTVINVDVSYLNDVGRAGFGVLFRTGDGLMVDCYSGFLCESSNTHAELAAILWGLKISRSLGVKILGM
jgi:ribonuclease HI